jgi:hypothetical protein
MRLKPCGSDAAVTDAVVGTDGVALDATDEDGCAVDNTLDDEALSTGSTGAGNVVTTGCCVGGTLVSLATLLGVAVVLALSTVAAGTLSANTHQAPALSNNSTVSASKILGTDQWVVTAAGGISADSGVGAGCNLTLMVSLADSDTAMLF